MKNGLNPTLSTSLHKKKQSKRRRIYPAGDWRVGSHSEGSGIKDKQNPDESKTKSRLCNRALDNFLGLEMVAVYLLVALNSGLDKMRKTMAKCCQELVTNGTITKRKGWSSCPWAINGLSNIFRPASWPSFQLIWPCLISLLMIVIELFSFSFD